MGTYGAPEPKKKANGKWFGRYWGPDGRQHQKTFDRKADCQAWLDAARTDRRRGQWIDPGKSTMKFGPWAEEWMRGRHNLEPSSRDRDESYLRNHVLPAFGKRSLGQIDPLEVRAWVNDLVVLKGLSPRTVRECYRILGSILRAAVAAKMIGESPLGRGVVDLPKVQRKAERHLTEVELEQFAQGIDPFFRPLVYTAAYAGLRWQEVAGLLRSNLDLKGRQLHVRTVTQRDRGRVHLKEFPKTDAGRRTIGLPLRLVEVLTFHMAAAPRGPLDLVFPGKKGHLIGESNFRQRHWDKAVDTFLSTLPAPRAAELDGMTFHDLRHTHAAWAIADGAQPLVLQRRLGHKDIGTTMNVYGHLFPNAEDDLIVDLDRRWMNAAGNA